ncbi:putative DExH-box ATP-dependent RNA helicase DExH17 [Nannochloris sp. 'desiccata']|nr:hypothetical protein KSW81_007431 [Chlorella desiccata (nom. nud.)]KAH7618659.1 putative DExH-box ATP-dependent RNA helicase DExH17 [Chlorella desiccata (nom. nud.)]
MWQQNRQTNPFGSATPDRRQPAPERAINTGLVSVADLPGCLQPVYSGNFRYFNSIQSDCYDLLMSNDNSVVCAAPTGSLKAVYLAPAKALVQEKAAEWTQKFGRTLGLSIKEVTGDTDQEDLASIDSADIICTTPEKFDAMTRRHRARGGMRFFNEIALVLIDEVHLLSEGRGSCLEAGVVSRIKLVACKPEMAGHPISRIRFIAVSATVPNAGDLAEWLGAPPQNIKIFGDEMRPVKLTTTVKGYQKTSNDFLFDRRLTDNIWPVITEYNRGRPALIFCSSRNGTASTAAHISREASRAAGGNRPSCLLRDPAHHAGLSQAACNVTDTQLRDCIVSGVGFHNASVTPEDRAVVESLFRAGDLLVLCTTSTLAVGVNLPAYLVVIKGTRRYAGAESSDLSGYEEYDRSTVLQMIGRAGRPQFDTEGAAVIMTQRDNTARYQQLVNSAESVESTLHLSLQEYLNAEIALGTINDLSAAIVWLRSTFLYVRVRREPAKYGIPPNVIRDGIQALETWLREELVMKTVRELSAHGMVRTDDEGYSLEPLEPGVIMAEHYVKLSTMVELCNCPVGGGVPQLLWVIARSNELSSIKLRRNEKKVMNLVNKSEALRHHVMSAKRPDRVVDRISTSADKLFILMNSALTDTPPEKLEYSLKQDAERAVSVGARLSRAMIKYFLHEQRAAEAFNALLLQKSLKQRLWTGSRLETRQVVGIGPVIAERLAASGIISLKQVLDLEPRRFETLAQKTYPWGSGIQSSLRRCLPPELELTCTPVAWISGGCVELKVTLSRSNIEAGSNRKDQNDNDGSSGRQCPGRLLVGTLHDNALLATRSLSLSTFNSPLEFKVKTKTCAVRAPVQVVASVVHEALVGVDLAIKTVVPHDAVLDGTPPPQSQLQPAEPALLHTPSGLVNTSDLASTGTEQVTGASKARSKRTAAPASVPKTKATHNKKKGKEEGVKDFTQRKLHEMKGLTPIPKKRAEYSTAHEMEGTGEAAVLLPSSILVAPPSAAQKQPAKQPDVLPSAGAGAGAVPPPVPNWKTFLSSYNPRLPPASLPPPPGTSAAATLQSPPSVISKPWKCPSPTPAININTRRAAIAVAVPPPKFTNLSPRAIASAPSVSRHPHAPLHAAVAGIGETSPFPSFGQFAFNAKPSMPLVQEKTAVTAVKGTDQVPRQRAASGGRSAAAPAAAQNEGIAAQPKKKQRIKLTNTPSSLNWLSTKFKTASASRKENTEN